MLLCGNIGALRHIAGKLQAENVAIEEKVQKNFRKSPKAVTKDVGRQIVWMGGNEMSKQDLLKFNPEDGKEDIQKTDKELMDEIIFMLENSSAEELDTAAIQAKLSVLDERDPAAEKFDPEKGWEAFITAHPFEAKAETKTDSAKAQPVKRKKGIVTVLRVFEVAVVLAAAMILFSSAAGQRPVQTFTKWTADLFSVAANPGGELELPEGSDSEYRSLHEALDQNGAQDALCPTWIPEGFALESVDVDGGKRNSVFTGCYVCEEKEIIVSISSHNPNWVANILETTEDTYVEQVINGDTYYILSNIEYTMAFCSKSGYAYNIRCESSEEDLFLIIDSLYR